LSHRVDHNGADRCRPGVLNPLGERGPQVVVRWYVA
jgi:hypothetical protein